VWDFWAGLATAAQWLQMAEWFKLGTKMPALLFPMRAVVGEMVRFMLLFLIWATSSGFLLNLLQILLRDDLPLAGT